MNDITIQVTDDANGFKIQFIQGDGVIQLFTGSDFEAANLSRESKIALRDFFIRLDLE